MNELKFSLVISFLGQTKDRFHSYIEPKTLEEKYRLVGEMKGVRDIEFIFPHEVKDPGIANKHAKENNQVFSTVNVNVKGEPEFRDGGLTSNDPKIRESKDFAYEVGADKVTCCPLFEGHEFPFHNDYRQKWGYMVERLQEAAECGSAMIDSYGLFPGHRTGVNRRRTDALVCLK